MLFKSEKYITWDTWVYYYDGTYYAYYLITDYSPGEGYGVAVSKDGVHFTDMGKCISASDKMVFYLGTGAVWKSPDFAQNKQFICNYSEWRRGDDGANVQNIFFAKSQDLIHWEKLGEDSVFQVDETYYKKYELEGGRWDCIFPYVENGEYHGFYTATPKDYFGCGYATSEDGIKWTAQKPPRFAIEEKGIRDGIELGAMCKHGDKYYILMGTYVNEYGIAVLVCDTLNGVYKPQEKNFALLANRSFRHAYFMRFFEKDGKLLVNHHCISRTENEYGRPTTLLCPFKEVNFDDEGILRLRWFEDNGILKGKSLPCASKVAFFAEGTLNGSLTVTDSVGKKTVFTVSKDNGGVTICEDGVVKEEISKDVAFADGQFILLYREGFIELYVDGWFITCYTLENPLDTVEVSAGGKIEFFELNI